MGKWLRVLRMAKYIWDMQMLWGCVFSHSQKGTKCRLTEIPDGLKITGRFGDMYA